MIKIVAENGSKYCSQLNYLEVFTICFLLRPPLILDCPDIDYLANKKFHAIKKTCFWISSVVKDDSYWDKLPVRFDIFRIVPDAQLPCASVCANERSLGWQRCRVYSPRQFGHEFGPLFRIDSRGYARQCVQPDPMSVVPTFSSVLQFCRRLGDMKYFAQLGTPQVASVIRKGALLPWRRERRRSWLNE